MEAVRELFREYAKSLGSAWVDTPACSASFERELTDLPNQYSSLLLAVDSDLLAGCAGLRNLGDGTGEVKRLYIRPAFQGRGVGRLLIERIVTEAQALGCRRLVLDTLPVMERALALYRAFGFREIPSYGDNPPEAICFELSL